MCVFRLVRLVSAALYISSAALYIFRYVMVRIYPHESALTRRMWDNTATSTHTDKHRTSWGQSAQTTTREVSFGILLADIQSTLNRDNNEVKEYIYIRMSVGLQNTKECSM